MMGKGRCIGGAVEGGVRRGLGKEELEGSEGVKVNIQEKRADSPG